MEYQSQQDIRQYYFEERLQIANIAHSRTIFFPPFLFCRLIFIV